MITGITLERFWAKVDQSGECWIWTASRIRKGYGKFNVNGRTVSTHRLAYELAHKIELTSDQFVLHSCDNPPCVNPKHLRVGTPKDNAADMDARGRRVVTSRPGESNPRAILTATDVLNMRAWRANTGVPYRVIAERYGVTLQAAYAAIKGATWRDVGSGV